MSEKEFEARRAEMPDDVLIHEVQKQISELAQRVNAQNPNDPKLIAVGKRLGKNGRNVIEYIAG